jgi:hypothetical protein
VLTGISVRSINQKVAATAAGQKADRLQTSSLGRAFLPQLQYQIYSQLFLSHSARLLFSPARHIALITIEHTGGLHFFAPHARALWCEWNFPHMVGKQRILAERDLAGSSSLKSRRRLPDTAARPVGQPAVRSGRGQAPRTFRGSSVGVWGRPPQPLYCCARRAVQLQSASLRKTLGNGDVEKCLRRHTPLSTS